jgi:hypothetical protein
MSEELSVSEHYSHRDLLNAGFEIVKDNDCRELALDFFKQLREKTEANVGLHILMQESTTAKIKNMIYNITQGYISPVEIIAKKL